jgi:hypothetical protein
MALEEMHLLDLTTIRQSYVLNAKEILGIVGIGTDLTPRALDRGNVGVELRIRGSESCCKREDRRSHPIRHWSHLGGELGRRYTGGAEADDDRASCTRCVLAVPIYSTKTKAVTTGRMLLNLESYSSRLRAPLEFHAGSRWFYYCSRCPAWYCATSGWTAGELRRVPEMTASRQRAPRSSRMWRPRAFHIRLCNPPQLGMGRVT